MHFEQFFPACDVVTERKFYVTTPLTPPSKQIKENLTHVLEGVSLVSSLLLVEAGDEDAATGSGVFFYIPRKTPGRSQPGISASSSDQCESDQEETDQHRNLSLWHLQPEKGAKMYRIILTGHQAGGLALRKIFRFCLSACSPVRRTLSKQTLLTSGRSQTHTHTCTHTQNTHTHTHTHIALANTGALMTYTHRRTEGHSQTRVFFHTPARTQRFHVHADMHTDTGKTHPQPLSLSPCHHTRTDPHHTHAHTHTRTHTHTHKHKSAHASTRTYRLKAGAPNAASTWRQVGLHCQMRLVHTHTKGAQKKSWKTPLTKGPIFHSWFPNSVDVCLVRSKVLMILHGSAKHHQICGFQTDK